MRLEGPGFARGDNPRRLMHLIWETRQISRADLARRTGLSRSTVSDIVQALLDRKLVREAGTGRSSGGRRPVIIAFNDDAYGILGIDLSASQIIVTVTNMRGQRLSWLQAPHSVREDPVGALETSVALARACIEDTDLTLDRILGAGVAVPSPVRIDQQGEIAPLFMPDWEGVQVVRTLHEALRVPVLVDNDANLGALAEHTWGDGQAYDNLTYLQLDTGVGAGHLIGGQIYRGGSGLAGEIGHIALDPQGPLCDCGQRGCLVTQIGGDALVARYAVVREAHGLPAEPDTGEFSLDAIVSAAVEGEAAARLVIEEAGARLGAALANLLVVLDPAAIFVGGRLGQAGEVLLKPVRDTLNAHTVWPALTDCQLAPSTVGGYTAALGAATLVLRRALAGTLPPPVDEVPLMATIP